MTKQNKPKSIEELLSEVGKVVDLEQQTFKTITDFLKKGGYGIGVLCIEDDMVPMGLNNENDDQMAWGKFGEKSGTRGIGDFLEFLESLLETSDGQDSDTVELSDVEEFIRKLSGMDSEEPSEGFSQKPHDQKVGSYGEGDVVDTTDIQKRSLQAFLRRMGMRLVYTDNGAYGEYTEETKKAVPYTRALSVISFDKCVQFYNKRNALCAKPINPKKLYLTIRDKEVVANKHLLSFHRPDEGWAEIQSLI